MALEVGAHGRGGALVIISFGWTTPALVAGHKTVTRRYWTPSHAAKFKAGMLVDAWNTSPRNVKGNPHKVATIRLIEDAYAAQRVPPEDWYKEGFQYLTEQALKVDGCNPIEIWDDWIRTQPRLYVVRFEVVELAVPS